MITIIDCGMGNLGSILNMLKKIGVTAVISSNIYDIEEAKKLILPGVGAFDNGMKNLNDRGLIPLINRKVLVDGVPILGICLGMQLFSKRSEEGVLPGLGWIDAETVRFRFNSAGTNLKIPHMGWNFVDIRRENLLFRGMDENPRFYFVHSYHVICNNSSDVLTTTSYGYNFISAVNKENIFGVQFHPEKSHKFGMRLLSNFIAL